MRSSWKRAVQSVAGLLAVAALVVLSGCSGNGGVEVKGAVVLNGKAVKLGPGEQLEINFVGMDGAKPVTASASYNQTSGTFTVVGPTSRGIPEGKYRVTVSTSSYGPRSQGDRFRGAFGPSNSPLVANVSHDSAQKLVIDVGRKAVTTQ